ncbi:MAG: VanZ family protein [Chloroflexi bacterium]|nr:MAG: VanZ family protein [Chloroflexota bacterium]
MLKTTGARLFGTLLGYITLIILLLTLNPFYLALPDQITFKLQSSFGNLIANILLFLPVGFLYRLTMKRGGAFLFGAGISLSIETAQLFIPARTSSVVDILANALGAGLGALIHDLLATRLALTPGMVGRLRLETPLMGLLYLLVPLLWIDVLALNESPNRWLLTLLLSLCGAIIFSGLFHHWLGSMNIRGVGYAGLAAGAWFLIGAGPTLLRPVPILIIAFGVMLLTALLTILPRSSKDRRFERNTLKLLFPVFALYLSLLALWFPFSPFNTWQVMFGFTDRVTDTSLQSLYPRVEQLAAFAVLGYLIAEWRGRLELPLRLDLPRLFLSVMGFALALELLSGFQSGRGASLIRLVLSSVGALLGGTIYHMARAHIRFLLGH